MNAIATQLSADDIADVAAYFASQSGAATGAKSMLLPNVAKSHVTFPEGYKESFVKRSEERRVGKECRSKWTTDSQDKPNRAGTMRSGRVSAGEAAEEP